jgi:hypothetical protein
MDYWFEKTTPAGTSEGNALALDLKLTEGIITQVWLFHPEGCQGLAHAAIYEGGHQRYPHNKESSYHGNDVPMIWADNYDLKAPALLKLKTWNDDVTYPHTVYVRITVLREGEDRTVTLLGEFMSIIQALLTAKRTG